MEPLDLDGLEAVARAATPGPWTVEKSVFADRVVLLAGNWSTGPLVPADAAYIAAANPSTVLRLVEMARLGEAWREAAADVLRDGETLVGVIGGSPADCQHTYDDENGDYCLLHNAEWSTRNGQDLGHCEWIEARMAAVPNWRASAQALAAKLLEAGRG